jgi:hypothetical protein
MLAMRAILGLAARPAVGASSLGGRLAQGMAERGRDGRHDAAPRRGGKRSENGIEVLGVHRKLPSENGRT